MTREISVDWPWPSEWESVEDVLSFYKDRLYPALSDFIGQMGEADTYIDYVQGPFTIANLTATHVLYAGTAGVVSGDANLTWSTNTLAITGTLNVTGDSSLDGAVVINESNADKDFRVEGSGASFTHLLFTNAGTNRVGVNTSTPADLFHIFDSAATNATYHPNTVCVVEATTNAMIQVSADTNAGIVFCDATSNPPPGAVIYDHANEWMEIIAGGNELLYIKDGYITTADGVELVVGDASATNPFVVWDEGTTAGWGGAYGGVVSRFRASEAKHTSVVIDAQTGYDPVLGLSENGSAMWDIRNDATATDEFQIRYQVGAANATRLAINNAGHFDFQSGNLVTLGTLGAGNATLGTIGCNEITVADGYGINLQEDITFTGATTENLIKIPDHLAVALDITEAGNSYLKFITTNGSEGAFFSKFVGIGAIPSGNDLRVYNASTVTFRVEGFADDANFDLYCGTDGGGPETCNLRFFDNATLKWRFGMDTAQNFTIFDNAGSGNIFLVNSNGNMRLSPAGGNVGLGTITFGTNADNVFAVFNGTAPTTSPADCFQMYSADINSVAGKAGMHIRSEEGGVLGTHGSAGTINQFHYQADVADDGTFTLPAFTDSCWGFIQAGNNEEYVIFTNDNDGDVILVANSANVVANADTDTNLCIGTAATQEPLTIKNRLGATKNVNVMIWYS